MPFGFLSQELISMWHLPRIPKILHVYWGYEILPYMHYATVSSFIRHNPDWDVWLWRPQEKTTNKTWSGSEHKYAVTCSDYLPVLEMLVDEINTFDFNQFNPLVVSDVHRSDYIRFYALSTFGGVWSDMDIIYFNPIDNLEVNVPDNAHKSTYVCISHYGHSNGFFMSTEGSEFFIAMKYMSRKEFNPSVYQSNGVNACNTWFPTVASIDKVSSCANIGMDAVYAHDAQHIGDFFTNCKPKFTEYSIGAHYYAGSPKWGQFMYETNGGLINLPNTLIGNLLRETIK